MNDRRTFLKSLAGLTAGLSLAPSSFAKANNSDRLGEVLPKRKLGRTGDPNENSDEQVSMLLCSEQVVTTLAGQRNGMPRK